MNRARERLTDELLVTRCQEGHRESFELLMRRWQRRLWCYARRLTGSHDDAWDATQETWLAVLRQLRRLDDPAWFAAWIHSIVRHKCADQCRRARRQRDVAKAAAQPQEDADRSHEQDASDAVRQAVRRLPADAQELLALKYTAELNVVEIAVVLGVPVGTVKSRLHHTRKQLRRILEGEEQ